MKVTHSQAEDHYELLREYARGIALDTLPISAKNSSGQLIVLKNALQLDSIDFQAQLASKAWSSFPERRINWDWTEGVPEYAWRHPKRFELSIRYKHNILCGLSLGRPTWNGSKLRLDFIEASPERTPLTGLIADITVSAAEAYADAIGAVELRIMNPVNERVKKHYLSSKHGFSFNKQENCCYKALIV